MSSGTNGNAPVAVEWPEKRREGEASVARRKKRLQAKQRCIILSRPYLSLFCALFSHSNLSQGLRVIVLDNNQSIARQGKEKNAHFISQKSSKNEKNSSETER